MGISKDSGDVALVILRDTFAPLFPWVRPPQREEARGWRAAPLQNPCMWLSVLQEARSGDEGVKHLLEATHTAARSAHTQLTTCQLCPLLSHPRPSMSPSCLSDSLFLRPPILLFSLNRPTWFRGAPPCALDCHTQGISPFMSPRPPVYMAHCAASCDF